MSLLRVITILMTLLRTGSVSPGATGGVRKSRASTQLQKKPLLTSGAPFLPQRGRPPNHMRQHQHMQPMEMPNAGLMLRNLQNMLAGKLPPPELVRELLVKLMPAVGPKREELDEVDATSSLSEPDTTAPCPGVYDALIKPSLGHLGLVFWQGSADLLLIFV
ncbi:hypothetical protein Ciccas_000705 [Cichlidogyrus casuarinus]|uniref:Uncharacterized protein n=1 Tax=Cichlidogyrus casuarinus TaxID=1844966 RepID=A0ABD2QMG2_9PLAT